MPVARAGAGAPPQAAVRRPTCARAPLIRVSPFGSVVDRLGDGAPASTRARFERRKDEAKGLQVDGMGAALRAAAHGLGVALAFDPLVDSEIRSGALVRVGPGVPTRGQVWLVCRPRERGLPAIRALRRWLLQESGAGLNTIQGSARLAFVVQSPSPR